MIQTPVSDAEQRLSRAAELADHLRQNPRDIKRDPEDLASQFGISTALAQQIKSTVRSGPTEAPRVRVSLAERMKLLKDQILRFAELAVSRPYLFEAAAALICTVLAFSPIGGDGLAIGLWFGFQAWCLLLKPRFRYGVLGSGFIWIFSAVRFFAILHGEKVEAPISWPVIAFLFGMSMCMLSLLVNGALVVVGGAIQIAAQRRRRSSLSRQDLLIRMFELQRELAALPVQTPKTYHPWVEFARQRLFLTAAVLVFLLTSIEHANSLLFHIDPFALQKAQAVQQSHPSKDVTVAIAPGIGSGGFMIVQTVIGLVAIAFRIAFGILATTWRKVWLVAGGMLVGYSLAAAWAIPAGAVGSMPLMFALGLPFQEAFSSLLVVVVTRFVIGFNRALATYRAGTAPDEASIVGELLEIRHRLSSHPTTICVLVVDAAGSTQMKKGTDQLKVEYSFGRYQRWIAKIISENGGKVEILTGDGAICAFSTAERALAAAQTIQTDVVRFNESENELDLPFRLRIALHAGLVQADLDKVQFTEVIDVAAHTEKHSPIGGIALTEAFIQALPTPLELPICATVDGFAVNAMTI